VVRGEIGSCTLKEEEEEEEREGAAKERIGSRGEVPRQGSCR
jgi:hypothetical protein